MDNQDVKEFEDRYKRQLFREFEELSFRQTDLIQQTSINEYFDLPNMEEIVHQKIIELSEIFQKANISMFSKKMKYGPYGLEFVGSYSMGNAIIDRLTRYVEEGIKVLERYKEEQTTKRHSFFRRPKKTINLFRIDEYINIGNQIKKYNLRDNIVADIINYMNKNRFSQETILEALEKDIEPDLQKLGLSDLIPQLKKELLEQSEMDRFGYSIRW